MSVIFLCNKQYIKKIKKTNKRVSPGRDTEQVSMKLVQVIPTQQII